MTIQFLRRQITTLVNNHHLCGIKSGTEIEDMTDPEIEFLRVISLVDGAPETPTHESADMPFDSAFNRQCRDAPRIVPLIVKTGGAEARRDIRTFLMIGVDVILAPMIESTYALSNFTQTAEELYSEMNDERQIPQPLLAINLETAAAAHNLSAMIESKAFSSLSQVTIGRGDLSKSMHLAVDDDEVMDLTRNILVKLKRNGMNTSVGGGLSLSNISKMARVLPSDRFNTRHMVLTNDEGFRASPEEHLKAALNFELVLYTELGERFPYRKDYYAKRSKVLKTRIEQGEII